MSAPTGHHADVAGYALGRLNPHERARFEAHLRACAACREELAELEEVAGLLALAPPAARAAGRPRGARAGGGAASRRRGRLGGARAGRGAAAARLDDRAWASRRIAAAAIAGAFFLGGRVLDDGPAGTREISAVLRAPGGGETASVEVTRTGIGRVVELSSDDLPILPKGELYEVWFVGPGRPPRLTAAHLGRHLPPRRGRADQGHPRRRG